MLYCLRNIASFYLLALVFSQSVSASSSEQIHLNQIGFLPDASKIAVIPNVDAGEFWLVSAKTKAELLRGPLTQAQEWKAAGETVKIADFSAFNKPGRYFIRVDGVKDSAPFRIDTGIFDELFKASIKSYYFNRSGAAVEPRFGGTHARPAGHPDSLVYIHTSAASKKRPKASTISSEKGWYDAGDYNKYIVNSGITTYTLLKAYEDFEDTFRSLKLNIPESENSIPDFIDEILWNLEWMRSMQDPNDGGVYHKLTTLTFTGKGMPHEQNQARYVVQKSTAATLNFAAVMAAASRLFEKKGDLFPGYAEDYAQAAETAWEWAKKHPKLLYTQPKDVKTGMYASANDDLEDEWLWAATEMFHLSGKKAYLKKLPTLEKLRVLDWGQVEHLAWFSLSSLPNVPTKIKSHARQQLMAHADEMVRRAWASGYLVPLINSDFRWGSNAVALNRAVILINANRVVPNDDYVSTARALLDYVLGRNPTGFSFVSGFGSKQVMNVHHRISYYDRIKSPVPGMVVGGPHPGQQDDCKYPSKLPAKSFYDGWCSYSTNEIAINWNAPLVYVLAALK